MMDKDLIKAKLIKQFKQSLKEEEYVIDSFEEIEMVVKHCPKTKVEVISDDITITKPITISNNIDFTQCDHITIASPNVIIKSFLYCTNVTIKAEYLKTSSIIMDDGELTILDYKGEDLNVPENVGITVVGVNDNFNIKTPIYYLTLQNSKITSYESFKNIDSLSIYKSSVPSDLSTLPTNISEILFTDITGLKEIGGNKHELEVINYDSKDKVKINPDLLCVHLIINPSKIQKEYDIDFKKIIRDKIIETLADNGVIIGKTYDIKDLQKWGRINGERNKTVKVADLQITTNNISLLDDKNLTILNITL